MSQWLVIRYRLVLENFSGSSDSFSNPESTTTESNLRKWVLSFAFINGILLPELLWPTVRKNCSSDQEKLLKFKAEGRRFAKFLRTLEQFIQTVKGQNNFR